MSLLRIAEQNRRGAVDTYGDLAQMQRNRENTNDQLKANHKANQANMAGGALSAGVTVGLMAGGPMGLAAGAGMLLLGSIF